MKVQKKNGLYEEFSEQKLLDAVHKSAERVEEVMTIEDDEKFVALVLRRIGLMGLEKVPVKRLHNFVELALDEVNPKVAESYRNYRNYRKVLADMTQDCMDYSLNLITGYRERENANADSALVATKQVLMRSFMDKQFYMMQFLTAREREAIKIGFIYVHDMSGRRYSGNCCLFDIENVLKDGFVMGNIYYQQPKSLTAFFGVVGDLVLSVASQQYGGFTLPEIDTVIVPYAKMSFEQYVRDMLDTLDVESIDELSERTREKVLRKAYRKVERDMEQGFQKWECMWNTVGSSRGDYPFTTITFGLEKDVFGRMASVCAMRVRKEGQGEKGKKIPVLFPKLVFLYDEKIHGPNAEMEDVFDEAILCSQKTMYPDYLSLSGKGYVAEVYKRYGKVISPMGCRAFLSLWFERGGMEPADEFDEPVFKGRFNIGVVSLNLPMILQESRVQNVDFYEMLEEYLQMIREIHIRTYAYLSKMLASSNPVAFCGGGFLNGNLNPGDVIASLLPSATASFGITALQELQMLYNKKPLTEDNAFVLQTLHFINKKINEWKYADGNLYAIYGTPAENLCGLQAKQFKARYGIIEGVSDRSYFSNSFHCHVSADITPIEKQDLEEPFWDLLNGGKIQYVKYPLEYNTDAIKTLVRRAMEKGYYEGANLSLSFCNECGYRSTEMGDICPSCGSSNVTQIDRMNGYLAYSKLSVKNSDGTFSHYSRLSDPKMEEIGDRRSM